MFNPGYVHSLVLCLLLDFLVYSALLDGIKVWFLCYHRLQFVQSKVTKEYLINVIRDLEEEKCWFRNELSGGVLLSTSSSGKVHIFFFVCKHGLQPGTNSNQRRTLG